MESYETLMLRDVYTETLRNGSDWQLNLRLHCETADIGVFYRGTWTIHLIDTKGNLVQQMIANTLILGDQERQATVHFHLTVPANQVRFQLYG